MLYFSLAGQPTYRANEIAERVIRISKSHALAIASVYGSHSETAVESLLNRLKVTGV